jgi:signal peptidase I
MTLAEWLKKRKERKANEKKPQTLGEHVWSWTKTIVWALSVVTIINGLFLASFTVPTGSMETTVMAGDYVFVNKFIYGPSTPQIIPFFNIPLPYYKLPAIIDPKPGDVIVFIFPGNRDQVAPTNFEYYLKRCVATAGDTLLVKDRQILVNGKLLPLPEHAQFLPLNSPLRASKVEDSRSGTFPPGRGYDMDNWGPMRIPKEGDVIQLSRENILEWATFIQREGHEVDVARLLIDGQPATSYAVERDYVFGMGDNRDNSLDSRFWGFIPKHDVVGTPMMVYWSWPVETGRIVRVRFEDGSEGYVPQPTTLGEKIASVRWRRIFNIIR